MVGVHSVLKYRLFTASLFFNAGERKSELEELGGGGGEVSCQVSRLTLVPSSLAVSSACSKNKNFKKIEGCDQSS